MMKKTISMLLALLLLTGMLSACGAKQTSEHKTPASDAPSAQTEVLTAPDRESELPSTEESFDPAPTEPEPVPSFSSADLEAKWYKGYSDGITEFHIAVTNHSAADFGIGATAVPLAADGTAMGEPAYLSQCLMIGHGETQYCYCCFELGEEVDSISISYDSFHFPEYPHYVPVLADLEIEEYHYEGNVTFKLTNNGTVDANVQANVLYLDEDDRVVYAEKTYFQDLDGGVSPGQTIYGTAQFPDWITYDYDHTAVIFEGQGIQGYATVWNRVSPDEFEIREYRQGSSRICTVTNHSDRDVMFALNAVCYDADGQVMCAATCKDSSYLLGAGRTLIEEVRFGQAAADADHTEYFVFPDPDTPYRDATDSLETECKNYSDGVQIHAVNTGDAPVTIYACALYFGKDGSIACTTGYVSDYNRETRTYETEAGGEAVDTLHSDIYDFTDVIVYVCAEYNGE